MQACLGDRRKVFDGKKEGLGCRIQSYGNQVFCSKGRFYMKSFINQISSNWLGLYEFYGLSKYC